jgi:hypothetical protein
VDKNFNAIEDFAESVTAFLYPEEAAKRAAERGYPYEKWGYAHFHETPRGLFIQELFVGDNWRLLRRLAGSSQ